MRRDPPLSSRSLDEIRRVIGESNKASVQGTQKYLVGENRAIDSAYDFTTCRCGDECWCKRNACVGHYRLKEVAFDEFLATYLTLWIPPKARRNVKDGVFEGAQFNGHERNSIPPLKWLQENWSTVLEKVTTYDRCGLCDPAVRLEDHVSSYYEVNNLYAGKMWSQLFYDSLVPFDSNSRAGIKRAGYSDPTTAFFATSRELFRDLRKLSEDHGLGVPDIRQLDSPWTVAHELQVPVGGQPLSRVVDKIFYSPSSSTMRRSSLVSRAGRPDLRG
jgi:hypothetical protein